MDSDMHSVSTDLRHFNIKGNIASNREYVPVQDAWHKTFRLAYWLDSRYYGQAGVGMDDTTLEKELKKNKIDYYFVWGEEPVIPQFLGGSRPIGYHHPITFCFPHRMAVRAFETLF